MPAQSISAAASSVHSRVGTPGAPTRLHADVVGTGLEVRAHRHRDLLA